MLQDLALGPDTVDVSMATLASVWARDPCDLSERQHEPLTEWESESVFNTSPPAGVMWMEQLSPHLQRNKQLQDTLLQREEELARLQEENTKLREFLSSSFVRDLEKKAKKLTADGRMKLKRSLMSVSDGPSQHCGHQLLGSQHVSKRVCRNLTAEFCSESHVTSASSEPNLDLWVLRTLGLKDRDTIDTSNEYLSSGSFLRSLVYDNAVISSSEHTLSSSFSPPVATSTPSSAHSYCQNTTCQTEYRYRAESQEANCDYSAKSHEICAASPGQHFTATGLTGQYEDPDVIRSYNTGFQCPPVTEELPFTQSPDRAETCSTTASSQALPLQENPAEHSVYWSSLQGSQTPSQDTVWFSPPGETIHCPLVGCRLTSPSAKSHSPATPQTLHSKTDLAFSMSLSPSSSVKTHSFPQGQAFVRKDSAGRWNFTWVPRQGP